ncbi:hypothetical protein CASFOL_018224 [Castilleja foliolosa]|uniref:MATE efflux family protein n=1 Tax=Castilleja foliolosa TaxID=1961234 RepID=A0ABD3D659_9LAMI
MQKLSYIAMPMVVVTVSQYLLRAMSMMMLGHLGELALASSTIAISIINATGFGLLTGLAGALETLCGQAYGAKQYKKLGTFTNGSIIFLCLACLPVFIAAKAGIYENLEWWTFEIVILLSGLLPNPELDINAVHILTITWLHFLIPYSFGVAASTRVSNELGAGKPQAARLVLTVVLLLGAAVFVFASSIIFICRFILGYLFSNEKRVVYYVKEMAPFLCASIVVDSLQAVLSGIVRGNGWQHIGAYINLGAYYLVGIPTSLYMGFVLNLKGQGLWSGLVAGATVQSILLGIVTFHTDWDKQAIKARRRLFDEKTCTIHEELIRNSKRHYLLLLIR